MVSGSHQASNMGSSKWHALNHMVDALQHLVSVEYPDLGVYKSAHKFFKEKYIALSQRRQTIMDELLTTDSEMGRLKNIQRRERHSQLRFVTALNSVMTGSILLVTSGRPCTFQHCLETRQKIYVIKHNKLCGSLIRLYVQMMVSKLKEDGLRVLTNVLSLEMSCLFWCEKKLFSTRIELVNLAYTVSVGAPT